MKIDVSSRADGSSDDRSELAAEVADRLQRSFTVTRRQPAGVASISARARQRIRRRRAATAGVGALSLVAGSVLVTTRDDDPPEYAVASYGDPGSGATTAEVAQAERPLDLQWGAAEGGLFNLRATTADETALYALSTEPGAHYTEGNWSLPTSLYRFEDDGTWTEVGLDVDASVSDVAALDGVLYGIGTGPAGHETIVSTSTDSGATWSEQPLMTQEAPSDVIGWRRWSSMSIVSSSDTVLAVVNTTFEPEWEDVFGDYDDSRHIVVPDEEGPRLVQLDETTGEGRDGEENVVEETTWDALGVSGPDELSSAENFVLGESGWSPVELPVLGARVETAGDGFLASRETVTVLPSADADADGANAQLLEDGDYVVEVDVWRSRDGLSWTPMDVPSGTESVAALGTMLVALDGTSSVQVSSDGGANWSTVDLGEIDPRLADTSAEGLVSGPLGIAFVASGSASATSEYVVATADVVNWDVVSLDELFSAEAAYDPAAPSMTSLSVGTDRIAISATLGNERDAPTLTAIGVPQR